jgi:putative ABC transport system substrate-binding protein
MWKKHMNKTLLSRFLASSSDNPKSKIQNPKWVGTVALVLAFTMGGAVARAQQPGKVPLIGYLSNAGHGSPTAEAFRQGLRELGYVEGQNIAIEYRSSEGNIDRLPALAAELVGLKVDIIFAGGATGRAAKKATSAIPIIFVGTPDPVATGLVASLARPGGNVTGFSIGAPGLYGKRLEIIKETIPKLTRVGLLWNPASAAGGGVALEELRGVGQELGVQIQSLEVRNAKDIDRAFEAAIKAQVGALVAAHHPPMFTNQKRIVELAAKHRLPAIYADTDWIQPGGLMSYGPSIPDLFRRSADYVDKILKGRPPSDLPVQQPMKYELMINLKTADALSLKIPPIVLMRAEKVVK